MRKSIMKKRTENLILCYIFSFGAFVWLILGCLALKLNYKWQAVFLLMCSLFTMLVVHAILINIALIHELVKKIKQEEMEDREKTMDGETVEHSDSTDAKKNKE